MPFAQFIPRPLTAGAVHTYAPTLPGVYGLSNARDMLLAHLQDSNTSLMKLEPTGFVFEVCDRARRLARQDRLVLEYEPTCNRRSPPRVLF